MTFVRLEHSTEVVDVHDAGACAGGVCPIHHRSGHRMRGWPQHWRGARDYLSWGLRCAPTCGNVFAMPSLAYELMDRQIDGGLASFIANLRSKGHSYRRIARQLSDVCGALVTDETVRRWHLEATDGEGDAA